MDSRPDDRRVPIALLAVAAAIRIPLAFWPNIVHPDEIFQYLEPAWRMLGHDGIVSWEWRYGMRSPLVPSLLAGPMALGDWMAPGGEGAFIAPRVLAALASLSTVACAWIVGARISRTHAIVAGIVATIWFEFVLFAPHTLGEPLATAFILPAALLITSSPARPRQIMIGGALLALAAVIRFQYAPAIAVLALGACWGTRRKMLPMAGGGLLALLAAALLDIAHGAMPFGWIAANIQQNWLHDRAADFGVMPASAYLTSFVSMWSVTLIVLIPAIVAGTRHAPLLLLAALVNIAFHTVIGHKEYRFIYLSIVLLILIAALGSADWIVQLRQRTRWALGAGVAGWLAVAVALGITGVMPASWMNGVAAARLAAAIGTDPATCGVALYDVPVPLLPGRERLAGQSALYAFVADDPAVANDPAAAAAGGAAAFNRLLAPRAVAASVPADFHKRLCGQAGGIATCVYAREGTCDPAAAARFLVNAVLARVDH